LSEIEKKKYGGFLFTYIMRVPFVPVLTYCRGFLMDIVSGKSKPYPLNKQKEGFSNRWNQIFALLTDELTHFGYLDNPECASWLCSFEPQLGKSCHRYIGGLTYTTRVVQSANPRPLKDFFSFRVSVSSRVSRATKSFSTLWSIFKSWAIRGRPSSTRFGESACSGKKDPPAPCSWRFMIFRTRGPPCFSSITSSSRSTRTPSVCCQFSFFVWFKLWEVRNYF